MDPDPKPIKQKNVKGNTKKNPTKLGRARLHLAPITDSWRNWFLWEETKEKPSEALKRIQKLNVNKDDIFQAIWLGKLPLHVQRGLTTLTYLPMKELAAKADKLMKLPPNIEGDEIKENSETFRRRMKRLITTDTTPQPLPKPKVLTETQKTILNKPNLSLERRAMLDTKA